MKKIITILLLFVFGAQVHGQKLTLNTQQVKPGDPIVVKFSGAPGNPKDWIGLYPESAAPDRSWLSWKYTSGKTSGEITFSAPATPGRYNFRLFPNDSYKLLSTSSSFVVSKTSASPQNSLPVDIAGSWYGNQDQRARLNFWQHGDKFTVVICWPDDKAGIWKTDMGEGVINGRLMKFVPYRSNLKGGALNSNRICYFTISDDNREIIGYTTINGQRIKGESHYYRVK